MTTTHKFPTQPTVDAVCVRASQAYIESSGIPDGPNKAAMLEYISQGIRKFRGLCKKDFLHWIIDITE